MMAPRIWIRGVGRTRAPSLYQFTAMPGRVLMSQRSFRTLPGSNRRCSVVSSLKSSRTSAKSRHGISLRCWRLFSSFYDQSEHPFRALLLLLFISFVALIIYHRAQSNRYSFSYDLQLLKLHYLQSPHTHKHNDIAMETGPYWPEPPPLPLPLFIFLFPCELLWDWERSG